MDVAADLEAMAATLESSGDYRVLRRLRPRAGFAPIPAGTKTWRGLMLDTETTGLAVEDEIIELAMISFSYSRDGTIHAIQDGFERLREPSRPIPPEVTELTGIDAATVAGQAIDPEEVAAFVAGADLIVAHNADFDRKVVERAYPVFKEKPWACSLTQVPWKAEGFGSAKLGQLLAAYGFFHDAHRAGDDCRATIELLARPLPKSGTTAMSNLLAAARAPGARIWATNSPYELKDTLKARGYRWADGANGGRRAWVIDVAEDTFEAEMSFLRSEIYRREDLALPVARLTAYNRFSDRIEAESQFWPPLERMGAGGAYREE
ncbi:MULTISPECIES: 3'-5' exonuclease [unclassified Xanthobacter]|uniref:3'-5' exonuclease n=1 Tax=unclassified Xanthobacter TaxID=2623496 RepID=UPI001F1A36C4|nr:MULTISPECIES: 3'-5' exonuclease [unclassified Xanthobacter]